jgi:thiol-disulfide isomerase/thioredoxin
MRNFTLTLIFFCAFAFANAQKKGRITTKEPAPKAGTENLYIYQPPKGLLIPEKAQASVVYINKQYNNKTIPLIKKGNNYEFLFKAPDSTAVLIIGIIDENGNTIDNNNDLGFISHLKDTKGNRPAITGITTAELLSGYAPYILKLKVPAASIINIYEEEYKLNTALKKENSYMNYLMLLYKEKKDIVKPRLLAYAKQMESVKNDERKWMQAVYIYSTLKMNESKQKMEDKILSVYPNGELAIQKFWNKFSSEKEPSEITMLTSMKEYITRFKDSSDDVKDNFYMSIINMYSQKKDWNGIKKYEPLVSNKLRLASAYNNTAWDLTGGTLHSPGTDLEFARTISKQTVDIVKERMSKLVNNDEKENMLLSYEMYSDTYALILYKLKQYDSAFYYQDAIQQRDQKDVSGIERYAAYAEKAKGALFAKQFIETQLLSGINSSTMLVQLQSIYKELNLPEDEYNKLKDKSTLLAKQKTSEKIKALYGTEKAKDFTLKDLEGKLISLSSLKNKVVVMDFWATWCGPCRASFPGMQEIINKYKNDEEVVFLFIDVFEDKDPVSMQKNAAKFIKDNKYNFQVLLDVKDKVGEDYKVQAIPAKFIINKKGNIVFMGETNNLALEIEAAKN